MSRKKKGLPFDRRGSVIVNRRRLYESNAWLSLPPQATKLMTLLQLHWRNDKAVDYGVREAMQKIGCAKLTARKAFQQLQDAGFLELVDESLFSSRTKSKSRTWRLTWLPFKDQPPTNEWEKLDQPEQKRTL